VCISLLTTIYRFHQPNSESPTYMPSYIPTKAPVAGIVPSTAPTTGSGLTTLSWDFEDQQFPIDPWTTGGDGVWAIDDTNADGGSVYSLKSPDLEDDTNPSPQLSNATLTLSDTFAGGVMRMRVLAR
jgi:hypothetical protein